MAAIPQLGILSMPDDPPRRTVPTAPLVLIFAMFFLTLCCLIISMAGGPGPAACVVGVSVVCGAVLSYIFKDRWH